MLNTMNTEYSVMMVQKRNGNYEGVSFDKITVRIRAQAINLKVDVYAVTRDTIASIYDGIKTSEIDVVSAEVANSYCLTHPDYSILSSRLLVSNLHKETPNEFSQCMRELGPEIWKPNLYRLMCSGIFDKYIDHTYDMQLSYVGYLTIAKIYLESLNGKTYDRYQYLLMRTAIATAPSIKTVERVEDLTAECLQFIVKTYKYLAKQYYTHATPTLINACKHKMQMISCFLYGTEDSLDGIMHTATNTAQISKWAGGIGIHMSNIRSQGQLIKGTGGGSSGLVRQLKIYNEIALTFDQGGRRKGAVSIYIEEWHADILEIMKLKLPQGDDSLRARDLFLARWTSDRFMQAVEDDAAWHLFSSNTSPGLSDVYDGMEVCERCRFCINSAYNKYIEPCTNEVCEHENLIDVNAFSVLYDRYVAESRYIEVIAAKTLASAIIASARESGTPYGLYKDHANVLSNQKNIGTIKSSNLCAEIIQHSDNDNYSSCCLASVNLSAMYDATKHEINHLKLHKIVEHVTRALDNVIDNNDYPVKECEAHAYNLRPIGIGIQGLADVFGMMRIPFDSPEAEKIDIRCAETMYHAALTASADMARTRGAYKGFAGSPLSKGQLKLDLWRKLQARRAKLDVDEHYDWNHMRELVAGGVRNSQVLANMPTASTSLILNNNDAFSPYYSNLYTNANIAAKAILVNRHMLRHLIELGLWNEELKTFIITNNGSIIGAPTVAAEIQDIYKTVFEIKQTYLMRRASMRAAYVDQSQSLNIHLNNNDDATLLGVMITGWKLGLVTGSYYIRTKPAAMPLKNTRVINNTSVAACYRNAECSSCGS